MIIEASVKNYLNNSAEGVDKATYLEMCELMGTEPDPAYMPVEYGDFPTEVQSAITVYGLLQDTWEPMSGTYLGKNLNSLKDIIALTDNSDNTLLIMQVVRLLDSTRTEIYELKAKQKESLKKPA